MTSRPSFTTSRSAMNRLSILSVRHLVPAFTAFAALAAAFTAGVRADAVAEVCPAATCAGEDVWLVSTRRLPGICRLPARAVFDVEQRCGGRWERSDLASLLDDPSRPLVIFIHGNRYEPHDAKAQGVTIARQVAAVCPGAAARTVIFSWPSQQQGHIIQSSRETYRRSYADGHYLAWLLGQVDPVQPVAIVGYSFGATIAVGAIEDLMQSGDRPSSGLAQWAGRPGRSHLVLVAPAVRSDALAPRGPYAPAVAGIDRLTLVINSRDLALRLFPHLDRADGADALGAVGMPRRWLPGSVEFTATDAASIVGKRHALPLYLESPTLVRRIASGAISGLTGE
ncbi:MAG: alpha/beta hydrolase [Planctomycetia bacterium]|nr:alpha/beta hydrolase [Planctomycetia bacterium]